MDNDLSWILLKNQLENCFSISSKMIESDFLVFPGINISFKALVCENRFAFLSCDVAHPKLSRFKCHRKLIATYAKRD